MTKVYEAIADAFVAEGTSHVFGMLGDANMHWCNAVAERGATLLDVRHEGSGLTMADGWARATGRPGVASATMGPGVTQLATALVAANRARTPLVVFAGEAALSDPGDSQYLDQRKFADAVECGFVSVAAPSRAHAAVRAAFFQARTTSRPVMVSAPMDVQLAEYEGPAEYLPSIGLIDATAVQPDPQRVEDAATIIAESERVVLLVGRGARGPEVAELVLQLQDKTHALLATTLQAINWLRDRTPYHAGIAGGYGTRIAHELMGEADCVIAVGAGLNQYTTWHGRLFPKADIVHIDRAEQVVPGAGGPVDCYVRGDARLTLRQLLVALEDRTPSGAGYHTPVVLERLREATILREPFHREDGRLDPREVVLALDESIPERVPLVLGSGHQTDFGTMLFARPREVVSNYGLFGAIGQAPLLTMGWSLGREGRPTFVVEGDASFIMHLAEFDTACRYGWPVLVVVMNDEALGAEYHKSEAHGLRRELSAIRSPDLGAVATAMGGTGATVRTIEDLGKAVGEFVAAPKPTVVDVRISRAVMSVPFRRLWRGEEI
ncbi:thiamine pyrophosphate-binding protein [Amycolatopsis jiangsuensis]|uniref:Thiamine pyrophosphate-dependent acetolactate synthase large subunit-like protein n=1 Tax=Amycolatopsis jiangsuensis TaxID=1181879 RepID=A0A840J7C2_9PSEU|nr:thiamine pyrophosphate-binding protein [Amycolatopsis jiangsuensis]MBB4689277.1 thiamine pyrophosphate-dependent acetolactate synthase large subunit-like protein [Amycolatopsis jiangsuensis]